MHNLDHALDAMAATDWHRLVAHRIARLMGVAYALLTVGGWATGAGLVEDE